MERVARVFHGFAEAERADEQYYASLTPNERVEILLDLVARYRESLGEAAKGFERIHRVVQLGVPVFFLGRDTLLRNKEATGRDQDIADARKLRATAAPRDPQ